MVWRVCAQELLKVDDDLHKIVMIDKRQKSFMRWFQVVGLWGESEDAKGGMA